MALKVGIRKMEANMKKIYLLIALFAALSTACNKNEMDPVQNGEEPKIEVKMITETVTGGKGTTKATIANADASFKWTAGDNIAVHVSNGDSHKYVFSSDAGASGASTAAASASFTVVYPEGYSRDAFALFPSTIVSENAANYGQSGTALDVTLPSSYTLAQVSDETSPCPMIATNTAGSGWDFYQLCGLLRLTVTDIPSTAKRLEIDFDGNKVWGDFSIASPISPSASVIATDTDTEHVIITITKDGSNTTLGATSLVLNIPLPTGDYSNITVVAYDAISGGTALKYGDVAFDYTAKNTKAVRRTVATTSDPFSYFAFNFKKPKDSNPSEWEDMANNLRFVRLFSGQNKLHNGATTYGPYTESSTTNINNLVPALLFFDKNPNDLLAFQVIDADGKVYSGSLNAPAGGYRIGKIYDGLTVYVKTYTFTVASGKKVFFSPGDLGKDGDVFSFTEPFTDWAKDTEYVGDTPPSKRSWFNYDEVDSNTDPGTQIYGITWRCQNYVSSSYEWNNIMGRTMNSGVSPYYKVTINGKSNCLLLPPDEATSEDIGSDITSGSIGIDYPKYLAKGFVLLMNAKKGTYDGTKKKIKWSTTYYAYWSLRNTDNRYYIQWASSDAPETTFGGQCRLHVRLVHNVQ